MKVVLAILSRLMLGPGVGSKQPVPSSFGITSDVLATNMGELHIQGFVAKLRNQRTFRPFADTQLLLAIFSLALPVYVGALGGPIWLNHDRGEITH
jgi:hypothetical protein